MRSTVEDPGFWSVFQFGWNILEGRIRIQFFFGGGRILIFSRVRSGHSHRNPELRSIIWEYRGTLGTYIRWYSSENDAHAWCELGTMTCFEAFVYIDMTEPLINIFKKSYFCSQVQEYRNINASLIIQL